jgi:hypothetical protein
VTRDAAAVRAEIQRFLPEADRSIELGFCFGLIEHVQQKLNLIFVLERLLAEAPPPW